jgi:cbb3-type cytochrome oxidase cytochrome c subunit
VNNGPLLFFGILATLASSFWTLLLAPQLQIGRQQPALLESTGQYYPATRPGLAQQGAEVYRAQGCAECHSQQVRQTGFDFELWLADAGSSKVELAAAMTRLKIPDVAKRIDEAPSKLLEGLTLADAQGVASQLTNGEAKAQAVLRTLGPDIERLWGRRGTVAQDYLRDYPVQLGSQRVGPDLANYGGRNTNANLILLHLYEPARTMPKSMMPPYRYLFTKQKLAAGEKAPANAVLVGGEAMVPKPEAEALVAYLMSLKAEDALAEAPTYAPPLKAVAAAPAPEVK